jgi:hypothetical protein
MNQKELIELCKEIVSLNHGLVLSGSLALNLQRLKTMREPSDLDFCFLKEQEFKAPEGCKELSSYNADDYHDEEWTRNRYSYKDIEFDVFNPTDQADTTKLTCFYTHGLACLDSYDILKFKIRHALDYSESRRKHKSDIVFILMNN